MKHLLFLHLIAFLVANIVTVRAQTQSNDSATASPKIFIGLAPSRTFFHFAISGGQGYSIEPEIKYRMGAIAVGGTFGISQYSPQSESIKNRYISGTYFELGVDWFASKEKFENQKKDIFSLSLHYVQAFAQERGSFYLKNSFGDYYQSYRRENLRISALKLCTNVWLKIHKKWQLVICPKIMYIDAPAITTYNAPPLNVPLNYMVGTGLIMGKSHNEKMWISGGVDVKLFYNLFSR